MVSSEDRDNRPIDRVSDHFNASCVLEDTPRIFQATIKLWCESEGLTWQPGRQLDRLDPPPITVSQEFLEPSDDTSDLRSSTSRSHQLNHSQPPVSTGAGWEDYDRFREWELHGRTIKTEWVKPGNWKKWDCFKFGFEYRDPATGELRDGDVVRADPRSPDAQPPAPPDMPNTLYEKLHQGQKGPANEAVPVEGVVVVEEIVVITFRVGRKFVTVRSSLHLSLLIILSNGKSLFVLLGFLSCSTRGLLARLDLDVKFAHISRQCYIRRSRTQMWSDSGR